MEGTLFKYGPGSSHVAFASGRHPRHLVMVGGLTDGLLGLPYARQLARRLEEAQWSCVQCQLTSSYQGWGLASLDQDADELLLLAQHLKANKGSTGWVLLGHSTGCQDAARYTRRHGGDPSAAPLLGVVLQAPVSDREWLATQPGTAERLCGAEAMVAAGRGEEVCFRATEIDGAAVCARRWCSLAGNRGDDDYFSTDLSNAELLDLTAGLRGLPTLVLASAADEYAPSLPAYLAFVERLAQAIGPTARLERVEGGCHSLRGHEEPAAQLVADFAKQLG